VTSTIPPSASPGAPAGDAASDERPGDPSLADVIRIVPERCYRNPTAKGLLYAVRDFAIYGVIVFALLATNTWWLLLPLWALAGLSVAGLFVLGHDAAHGSLFASKHLNRWVARVAFLPAAHVREAWDLGHNRIHHGHTVQQGMDFVWHPVTVEEYQAMSRFERLRHRVEWSWFGAGLYYGRQVWWHKIMRFTPPRKWAERIRRDRVQVIAALVLVGAGLAALGWVQHGGVLGALWTFVKVALIPWALFTWLIGFTVYVHHIDEDIRWYPRRVWSRFKGQMEGTTNLRSPRFMAVFFHNIFVHVPHHVDMRIPFYELPRAARAIRDAYPETVHERRFSLRRYLRTTRTCKLYDFERGVWLPLSSAKVRPETPSVAQAA
jgi:omega-6 fatty acid desaturase (delta-12 desaturase)